jgi:RND family efflux transporter MFP subunit
MKRNVVLLAGLAWLLGGCSPSEPPASGGAGAGKSEGSPALETVVVQAQMLSTTVPLSGELTPYESVALFPRVQGFVEQIAVDRGSRVKAGQFLARLSAPELLSQRAEAASKAHADRSTYERLRAASATPGAVSKHEIELAEAAAKAGESRVRALETLAEYLLVKAPFDGTVTERNVHPGALVGPPTGANAVPMLRIEQTTRLRLSVAVPESYLGSVTEGVSAEFSVRAWPGERFRAGVQRIAHTLDPHTRTMPVELDVDNSAGKLAAGMFVEVYWPVRRTTQSLFVPATAVVRTTERTSVSRVADGVLEQVPVQLGATMGDRTEVFGTLRAGDIVLKRGREELATGTRVKTRPEAKAP